MSKRPAGDPPAAPAQSADRSSPATVVKVDTVYTHTLRFTLSDGREFDAIVKGPGDQALPGARDILKAAILASIV